MKTTILTLVATLVAAAAFGQLQSGSRFVGTHVGGSITKPDAFTKATSYHVAPTFGYFISSNWMLSIQGQFGKSSSEHVRTTTPTSSGYTSYYTVSGNVKSTSYSFGPSARYYHSLGEKFAFFAEITAGYSSSKLKAESQSSYFPYVPGINGQPVGTPWGVPSNVYQSSQNNETTENNLYGSIAPGVVFFPSSRIGVELKAHLLNYTYHTDKRSQAEATFNLSKTSIGAGLYF